MKHSTCIGIDAHSQSNVVCALDTQTGEICEGRLSADPRELRKWIEQRAFPEPLACVYEAGPTGFGLARHLSSAGIECFVAATSKLPRRTDRAKNDRNDAEWLARQLSAGAVRKVRIPSPEEESLCRLSKLRGEAAQDLRRAKQRVQSFLLLTGTEYTLTKKRWTKTFVSWAESYVFPSPEDTFTFKEKVSEFKRASERLQRIDGEIERVVGSSPALQDKMARLTCIHGIGRVTAFSLLCEVYDFERFSRGSAFASFLGLVPSESSTGKKTSRGSITKLGNTNLRRLLVESASCYSRRPNPAARKYEGVSSAVAAKARKCEDRLFARRRKLRERGVAANKAKLAVARELAEWIYYIMVMPG